MIDPEHLLPLMATVLGIVGAIVHTAAFLILEPKVIRRFSTAIGIATAVATLTLAIGVWWNVGKLSWPLAGSHFAVGLFVLGLAIAFAFFTTAAIVRRVTNEI